LFELIRLLLILLIKSVAETTVAALLAGEFAPTGPFKSFKDTYTKPLTLADLLVRNICARETSKGYHTCPTTAMHLK
jgi:hypothetical protein